MTLKGTLSSRLTQVDELNRADHYHLDDDDICLYLGEYTARQGYAFSDTNNLIINFKKKPDRKGTAGWKYKGIAIARAGGLFRGALNEEFLKTATHVPIPPSRIKGDPLYDDRMLQMLQIGYAGLRVDIRELVVQKKKMDAAHDSDVRPTPTDLIANYKIDEKIAKPTPNAIMIYDDVLTTGAHYKAIQHVLKERYPGVRIAGLFIARRVPEASDPSLDFGDL